MDDGQTDAQLAAVATASVAHDGPPSKCDSALSQSPTPATDDAATTKPVPATTNGNGDADATSNHPVDTAASDAESAANGDELNAAGETPAKADATPQTTTPAANEVDLDQCRVCLAKADLVDIFSMGDENMRICDIVMTVCRVKILERDHLPHFLCLACVDKVSAALCFKNTCEAADAQLRSKLKRSQKTVRRSRGDFILVDCRMSSSDEEEEVITKDADAAGSTNTSGRRRWRRDQDLDDDFRISDDEVEEASLAGDSSDSTYNVKSSAGVPKRVGRPRGRKPKPPSVTVAGRKSSKATKSSSYQHDVVYVDAAASSGDSDADWAVGKQPPPPPPGATPAPKRGRGRPRKDAAAASAATPVKPAPAAAKPVSSTVLSTSTPTSRLPHKKRALRHADTSDDDDDDEYLVPAKKSPATPRKEHPCPYCDEVFATAERLKEHKKKYIGQKPLTCSTCGKSFKQRTSFEAHVRRHQEDEAKRHCIDCDLRFTTRIELRRHEQSMHGLTFVCELCRRPFTSQARLDQHSAGKCAAKRLKLEPTFVRQAAKGKDLFQSVAPLTTTYWSDSFSD